MSQTTLTKALVIASFLATTAIGLYAADTVLRPPVAAVELAALPGPAIQRDADGTPTPRECDEQRNIVENCLY